MRKLDNFFAVYNRLRLLVKQRNVNNIRTIVKEYADRAFKIDQSYILDPFVLHKKDFTMLCDYIIVSLILDASADMEELLKFSEIRKLISGFFSNYCMCSLCNTNSNILFNNLFRKVLDLVLDNDSRSFELIRRIEEIQEINSEENIEILIYAAYYSGNIEAIKVFCDGLMKCADNDDCNYDYWYNRFSLMEILVDLGMFEELDRLYYKLTENDGDLFEDITFEYDKKIITQIAERYKDENFIHNLLRCILLIVTDTSAFQNEKEEKISDYIDVLAEITFKSSDAVTIFNAYSSEKHEAREKNGEIILNLLSDNAVFKLQDQLCRPREYYSELGKWINENHVILSIDNITDEIPDIIFENNVNIFECPDISIYKSSCIRDLIKNNKVICNGNIKDNLYINGLIKNNSTAFPLILNALDITPEMGSELIELCIEHKNISALNMVRHLITEKYK